MEEVVSKITNVESKLQVIETLQEKEFSEWTTKEKNKYGRDESQARQQLLKEKEQLIEEKLILLRHKYPPMPGGMQEQGIKENEEMFAKLTLNEKSYIKQSADLLNFDPNKLFYEMLPDLQVYPQRLAKAPVNVVKTSIMVKLLDKIEKHDSRLLKIYVGGPTLCGKSVDLYFVVCALRNQGKKVFYVPDMRNLLLSQDPFQLFLKLVFLCFQGENERQEIEKIITDRSKNAMSNILKWITKQVGIIVICDRQNVIFEDEYKESPFIECCKHLANFLLIDPSHFAVHILCGSGNNKFKDSIQKEFGSTVEMYDVLGVSQDEFDLWTASVKLEKDDANKIAYFSGRVIGLASLLYDNVNQLEEKVDLFLREYADSHFKWKESTTNQANLRDLLLNNQRISGCHVDCNLGYKTGAKYVPINPIAGTILWKECLNQNDNDYALSLQSLLCHYGNPSTLGFAFENAVLRAMTLQEGKKMTIHSWKDGCDRDVDLSFKNLIKWTPASSDFPISSLKADKDLNQGHAFIPTMCKLEPFNYEGVDGYGINADFIHFVVQVTDAADPWASHDVSTLGNWFNHDGLVTKIRKIVGSSDHMFHSNLTRGIKHIFHDKSSILPNVVYLMVSSLPNAVIKSKYQQAWKNDNFRHIYFIGKEDLECWKGGSFSDIFQKHCKQKNK